MSKKQSKDNFSAHNHLDQDQWLMLLPDSCTTENEDNNPTFCQLRHPKTDKPCQFLLSADNSLIYEVLRFNDKYRSWFIGETVQADGSLYLSTPVDAVFLVLPYLIRAGQGGKFMQLEQIIEDADFPECNRLCSCGGLDHLHQVTQVKGADDYKVYRYDKDKTLSWLKAKVAKLKTILKAKKMQVNSLVSYSSTYIASSKCTEATQEDLERFAHGMISEYLSPELSQMLKSHLGIKDIVHDKPEIDEPKSKRRKSEVGPNEDYSQQTQPSEDKQKNTRLTLKQKQLEKVDKKGMKNISSFFSPKSKK